MKVEERLKELGFEQSPYNLDQWYYDQLDVCVYVNGEGKITGVQVMKSWHLDSKSYRVYDNYSNRDDYLIKVMHLLEKINRML